MGTAAGLLREMRSLIGLGETPPGSNVNKVTRWYNEKIDRIGYGPWCNQAITYAGAKSSNLEAIYAGKGKGFAYTVYHAEEFRKQGRWHYGTAGIQPGDVVFFDWTGTRLIVAVDHVGVVEKVVGRTIYTIEANVGNTCRREARDSTYIVGYGRPAYTRSSPKPAGVHAPSGYPLLRRGSSGTRVKQLQKALMKAGEKLPKYGADGDFGSETVAALRSFQRKHKLVDDAEYGPKSAKALKKVVG